MRQDVLPGLPCQRAVYQQEKLVGSPCGLWMAELADLVLKQLVNALAVFTRDGMRRVTEIGQGEICSQVAAAAEVRLAYDCGEPVEYGQNAGARILAAAMRRLHLARCLPAERGWPCPVSLRGSLDLHW